MNLYFILSKAGSHLVNHYRLKLYFLSIQILRRVISNYKSIAEMTILHKTTFRLDCGWWL